MSTEAKIHDHRPCDFCKFMPPPGEHKRNAKFDGKTTEGPWANMCDYHFEKYGIGLGTGRGQRLIIKRYAAVQEGDEVYLRAKVARANDGQALIEFSSMEGPFSVRVPLSELTLRED